jgi:predicted MPP superfamily phosphohydrolase
MIFLTTFFIIISFLLILGYFFAMQIKIKDHQISSEKIDSNVKIVFFTDLHLNLLNSLFNRNIKIANMINHQKPDIVVFGGDLTSQKITKGLLKQRAHNYAKFLSKIECANKYYINGNHDHKFSITDYKRIMIHNGFKSLNSKKYDHSATISIIGIDDLKYGKINEPKIDMQKYNLCLSHNPDALFSLINNYDLIISGHTHSGQGNIFGYNPMLKYVTNNPDLFNSEEQILVNNQNIIISAGLGSHFNLRYFQTPKFSVIKLSKKE